MSNPPPWLQPDWLGQASAWIAAELERLDLHPGGPLEQPHVRPWSTVLRVPTDAGDLYFKAVAPIVGHEPALVQWLYRLRPDCVPPLLAADLGRGWMLMADGGTRLREIIRADHDLRHWERLLPLYANLQIELASQVGELLALGAPDRRLAALPALYEQLLSDRETLRVGLADGLTPAEEQRLHNLTPKFAALCEQLASCRVPQSLHHGDLHDANIFVQGGRPRFFDWGDSCLAQPFLTLRTVFVSAEISLGLPEGAAELERLRDAYLEPWEIYESRAALLGAFQLAQRVASINGALTWQRVVSSLDTQTRQEYAAPVPALLQEFLGFEAG